MHVEVWSGRRRTRLHDPSAAQGVPIDDEPTMDRGACYLVPPGASLRLGREPAPSPAGPSHRKWVTVRLGQDDAALSRTALVIQEHGRGLWILECRNRRGSEVVRWAGVHRQLVQEGHRYCVLAGRTAILLRSKEWIYWVLLTLGARQRDAETTFHRQWRASGGALQLTLPHPGERDLHITERQQETFSYVYRQFLSWPPHLLPELPIRDEVRKALPKPEEKLQRIQSRAMREGFLVSGPGTWSPALAGFLAEHHFIDFAWRTPPWKHAAVATDCARASSPPCILLEATLDLRDRLARDAAE